MQLRMASALVRMPHLAVHAARERAVAVLGQRHARHRLPDAIRRHFTRTCKTGSAPVLSATA